MKKRQLLTAGLLTLALAGWGGNSLAAQDDIDLEDAQDPMRIEDPDNPDGSFSQEPFGSFGAFADDSFGFGDFSTSPWSWGVFASVGSRWYLEQPSSGNGDNFEALAYFLFDAEYRGKSVDLYGRLKFDPWMGDYPEDILDEAYIRAYLGDFILEAGKIRVVWGKGDGAHVVDNFNANDFRNFIIPDYIDRRLAEPMLRGIYRHPSGLRLEAVYAPMMTPDRAADSGFWAPSNIKLMESVQSYLPLPIYIDGLISGNVMDDLLPNTNSLEYGQFGLRLSHTFGRFDLGASYYYGHNKIPSWNFSGLVKNYEDFKASVDPDRMNLLLQPSSIPTLHYDKLQVFGVEAATVVGKFNLRGEFAYYRTPDVRGDDPWVRNNSLRWVVGFDVNLPWHNLNLNIQDVGYYVLHNDRITNPLDVDYMLNGRYSSNMISATLTDTFLREKLSVGCSLIYNIEKGDFIIKPEVTYDLREGLSVNLLGMYISSGVNGEFRDYDNNSLVQLTLNYRF